MSIEKRAYLAAQEFLRQRYGKKIIFSLSSDNLRRCDAAYDMIYFDNLMTFVDFAAKTENNVEIFDHTKPSFEAMAHAIDIYVGSDADPRPKSEREKVCDVRYDHLIITVGEDGKVRLMKELYDVIPPTSKESSLMTMTDKLALIFAKIMKATDIDDTHELAQKGVALCSHLASEEIEKWL